MFCILKRQRGLVKDCGRWMVAPAAHGELTVGLYMP